MWEFVPIPVISLLSLGRLPGLAGVYVASGLGSSGLSHWSHHWLPSSPTGSRQGDDLGSLNYPIEKLCQRGKEALNFY